MSYEISKSLVLSTAHVSGKLAARLDKGEDLGLAYYPLEHGWYVYVGFAVPPESFPKKMRDAVVLAKSLDCTWLHYDCDGPKIEELKTYAW